MKVYLFKKIPKESNRYQFYNIEKTQGYWRISKLEFYNFYRDNVRGATPSQTQRPVGGGARDRRRRRGPFRARRNGLHAEIRATRFEALEPCFKAAHLY